ncbi:MAG: PIN domain-containing protein [Thermoanaerobaculia bacterium]|mgnify:CR=1 FL=1
MKGVLADTGPLYALLDPSDSRHQRALREAALADRSGLRVLVCWPTVVETHRLALHKLGSRVARRWLEEVTSSADLLNPRAEEYSEAASQLRSYEDQRISLHDSVLAALARRMVVPVWTYDHHFDLLGASVWR